MQLINNKYRVVKTLNKGKEEESYVVENIKNPSSKLFLKILNRHDHSEVIDDLIENIQSYKNFTQENLLSSYGIELINNINLKEVNKLLYCVTSEYIEWKTLDKKLESSKDSIPVESLYQIIDTLAYLQFRGIVYKVLNPSNVYYKDGQIKLTNLTSSSEEFYDININFDHNQYLAPEILSNDDNVDYKADIYSLGILLKVWPFDFSVLNESGKNKIDDLVAICTSKDPLKRILDFSAIINKLEEITGVKHSVDYLNDRNKLFFRTKLVGGEDFLKKVQRIETLIDQGHSFENKVLVSGGNGTGKTRVLKEILFRSEMRGSRTCTMEIDESDTYTLLSITNFISNVLAMSDMESSSKIDNPSIFTIYNKGESLTFDLSKIDDRYKVFNLLIAEIQKLSHNRFIYVGVSGLEYGDHEFFSMLEYISSKLRFRKVLFVFTLNEGNIVDPLSADIINEWKPRNQESYILLDNLSYENTSLMVKEVLGIGYAPKNFAKVLYQETKGNPRYLEMIIKHIFDKGELYINENGSWAVVDRDYSALDYPKSYNDTISNQLVGFSEGDIKILKIISAFDAPAPIKYLLKHLEVNLGELNSCIDKFIERRVLNFRTTDVDAVFYVEQDLKEYVYDNLIEDKPIVHNMISEYIIYDKENNISYNFDELIFQLARSDKHNKCLEIIDERISNQNNMYSDLVIGLLETSLEIINGHNPEKELEILFQLADKTLIKGDLTSLSKYLERLDQLSLELGRLDVYLYSQIYKADIQVKKNEISEAMRALSEMEDEIGNIHDIKLRVFALLTKAKALISAGDLERLQVVVKEAIDLSLRNRVDSYLGDLYNIRGISEAMFGNYKVALDFYNLAIDSYRKSKKEFEMVKPTNNIGNLYNEIYGRPKTALDYYFRSYEISEKYGLVSMQATFLNNIGEVYLTLQDFESAKEYLLKAMELSKVTGDTRLSFLSSVNLGMIYLKTERLKEAVEIFLLIREINKREPILDKEINIHYTNFLGEYYLSMGDTESAKMFSNISMERSKEISIKNYLTNKSRLFFISTMEKKHFDFNEYEELLKEFESKGGDYQRTHFVLLSTTLAMQIKDFENAYKVIEEFTNINNKESLKLFMDDYEIIKRLIGRNKSQASQALNILLENKYRLKRLKPDYLRFIAESYCKSNSEKSAIGIYLMILDYGYTMVKGISEISEKEKALIRIKIPEARAKLDGILKKLGFVLTDNLKQAELFDSSIVSKYLCLIKDDPTIKIVNNLKRLPNINITAELVSELTDNYEENIRLTQEHLMDLTMAKRSMVRIFSISEDVKSMDIKIGDFPVDFEIKKVVEAEILKGRTFYFVRGDHDSFNRKDINGFTEENTVGMIVVPLIYKEPAKTFVKKNRRKRSTQKNRIRGYLYLDTTSYINRFNSETVDRINKLINIILINIDGMKLHKSSSIDTTTGLLTRDVIEERFIELLNEYSDSNSEFSVLMMDIDRFKTINDTYGHIVGDSVLAVIGETLRETLRDTDDVGRYGGEEFIAILDDISADDAYEVAQKIRKRVSEISIPVVKDSITISIGISCFPSHGSERDELIAKADQALYYAKEVLGRNKAIIWNDGMGRIQDFDDQALEINLDNIARDSKKLSSFVEVATLGRREMSFESRVDFFLSKVIECVSGYNTILSVFDTEENHSDYVKFIVQSDEGKILSINKDDIAYINESRRGRIYIDWTNDDSGGASFRHKDFDSVVIVPLIRNGHIIGILKVSVPLRVKEFTNRDLNYLEVLSSVFSGNLV